MSKKNTCAKRVFAFLMAVLIAVTYMPTSLFAYAEDFVIEDQVTEDTSEDVVEPAQDDQVVAQKDTNLGETVVQQEVTIPVEETSTADADTAVSDETAVEEPAGDATEVTKEDQGETENANPGDLVERQDPEDLETVTPDDQATKEEPTEEPTQTLYPANSFNGEAGGIKVNVSAPEGALPEGTTMVAEPVDSKDVEDAVSEAVSGNIIRMTAVDITFIDADGNEIEPLIPVAVTLNVPGTTRGAHKEIVHIDDEGEAETVENINVANTGAFLFNSDQFSVYVVVETGADARKAGGYTMVFDPGQFLYFDKSQCKDLTADARKALNIPAGRTLEDLEKELQAQQQ